MPDNRQRLVELADEIAAGMQRVRDEIGATEQQRIAFAYAEAEMRSVIARSQQSDSDTD
jgi:hypothetical protein